MLEATLRSVRSHIEARMKAREAAVYPDAAENMVDQVCLDAIDQCIADGHEVELRAKADREVDEALRNLFFGGANNGARTVLHP